MSSDGGYELAAPVEEFVVPFTLQDSLTARLDRLGDARETAQLSATFGREVTYPMLEAVSPLESRELDRHLSQMVEAGVVFEVAAQPTPTYRFKHALFQGAAYQTQLLSTRRETHRRIADALAERFQEVVETQPELLAHHYAEAGMAREAIIQWLGAGRRASEQSANVEAAQHLRTANDRCATSSPSSMDAAARRRV